MSAAMTRFPPAQLAVIALAAQGHQNTAIAQELHLSVGAVKSRLVLAMRATGAVSRAGLVVRACRWGQLRSLPRVRVGRPALSRADVETLRDVAADLSSQQIASARGVSDDAARSRCRHLYRQLGATDRAHAVLIAWQLRVLPEGAGRDGVVAGAGDAPGRPVAPSRSRAASVPVAALLGASRGGAL